MLKCLCYKEELRKGAWAQVEPPRAELALDTVAEMGIKGDWEMVIQDEERRSYAAVCRQAIDQDLAWQWFEALLGLDVHVYMVK